MPLNEDYEAEFEKALAEMAAQTEGFTEDMRDVIEKALPPPVVDADTAACRALRAIRYHKAQFERLERSYKDEIAELEGALSELTADIEAASTARDVERVQALSEEYRQAEGRLAGRLHEWEASASAAEAE